MNGTRGSDQENRPRRIGRIEGPDCASRETLDTLREGKVAIIQARKGYRFSLDSVLLANFVGIKGKEKVVDLGSGNAPVALLLAARHPSATVVGVEIQREMVERARRAIGLGHFEDRVEIVQGDVRKARELLCGQFYDRVVCNPPYRPQQTGRVNPNSEKRIARHEVFGDLNDFLRAGAYLLRKGSPMALVYPAWRAVDLIEGMRRQDIEPKRMRFVHSFEDAPASLILVEGNKGGGKELEVLAPLVVYTKDRNYTPELRDILNP
ncbi:MAG: tRNA1(Val) (adenine(37)-N6)-methyltransferase [Candidatus Binatia bacterium]